MSHSVPASSYDELFEVGVEEAAEVLHELLHGEDHAVHQDGAHRRRGLLLLIVVVGGDLVEEPGHEGRKEQKLERL